MLAVLAFIVLARPAPITITIRGAAVSEAVRQIGIASGLTLRTRAPIQNQMVLVHVQDTPVEALLEHLADAVHGEWLEDGKARVLTRSAKLQTALLNAQRDRSAVRIDETLRKLSRHQAPWSQDICRAVVADIARMRNDPAGSEGLALLEARLPFRVALVQLLIHIGGKRLALVGEKEQMERRVYSNVPNARQLKFPEQCDKVIAELLERASEVAKEANRQGVVLPLYTGTPSEATGRSGGMQPPIYFAQPPLGPKTRLVLALQRDRATLRVSGMPTAESLWLAEEMDPPAPPRYRYPEEPIQLGTTARWIAEWWQSRRGQVGAPPLQPEIRDSLLSPADRPRIGTLIYEAIDALGASGASDIGERGQARPWVACLSTVGQRRIEPALLPESTLRRAALALELNGCEMLEQGGWLIVRPVNPLPIEWLDKPPESLQRLVRRVDREGAMRFMDVAELYAEIGPFMVPDEIAMLGHPAASLRLSTLVPLVGSMSPAQRLAAASPSGIRLRQLAPLQVALAEQALYEENEWRRAPYEVTDAYPSGIPLDSVFRLQIQSRDVAQPWVPTTPGARMPLFDAGQLADQIRRRTQGESRGYASDMADSYLQGSQNRFLIRLELALGGIVELDADEPPRFDSKPKPWQEFSEPLRTEIEKRLKGGSER